MHRAGERYETAVVIRPGALGDVLVARHLVRFLRDDLGVRRLIFIAPGERGRFFLRPGWADATHDLERASFSWLFSRDGVTPPEYLHAVFANAGLVVAFVGDTASSSGRVAHARLREIAPHSRIICASPRPEEGAGGYYVGEWLIDTVCAHLTAAPVHYHGQDLYKDRFRVECASLCGDVGRYLVVHPGSGSREKNWPVDKYRQVVDLCRKAEDAQGKRLFSSIVVTSGEADGDIGENVAGRLPGVMHCHAPPLEDLAGLLAGARCYVGNDSGVSHLAASVMDSAGRYPGQVLVFGPSDASIWCPPKAVAITGEREFAELDAATVMGKILDRVYAEKA